MDIKLRYDDISYKRTFFIVFLLLYAITLFFTHIYSASIDNFLISCVLNGVYDAENYCIYLHPLLCRAVKFLNGFFPDADLYCVLQTVFIFLGYAQFMYCILRTINGIKHLIAFSILSLSLMVLLDIAHSNFTIVAAFYSFTGFITLGFYARSKSGCLSLIAGLFFICLSAFWRIESVYLLLPYFLLVSVATPFSTNSTSREKKEFLPKSLLIIILSLSCLFIIYTTKSSVDSQIPYADAVAYNSARGSLQDYPICPYEDFADSSNSIGLSENDYKVITDTVLLDTDVETTSFLQQVSSFLSAKKENYSFSRFITGLLEDASVYSIFSMAFMFFIFLAYSIFIFRSSTKILKAECICAIIGTILILTYFIFIGRLPERIIISLLFGLLQIPIARYSCVKGKNSNKPSKKLLTFFCALIVLVIVISLFSFCGNFAVLQNPLAVKSDVDYGPYEIVLDNDNLYIWDTYYMKNLVFETLIPQGKLYTADFVDNNIPDGEWIYGQPYFNNYLSRIGVENPLKELLYNDHCYYISRQYRKDILLNYIREHYDSEATAVQCGDIVLDLNRSLAVFKIIPGTVSE